MKKVLTPLLIILVITVVTAGFFVTRRYILNPEQIVPFPYAFEQKAQDLTLDAPILIIGDSMGSYLAKFAPTLAHSISINLERPIKIQTIATPGHALHRSLHQLKALTQWPQILIYQGASEEFYENKFLLSEIPKIKENFGRYKDDRIETFLLLYPWLSRLIYEPVKRVKLPAHLVRAETEVQDEEKNYLKKLETELLLFEQHLIELVLRSKDRNSLLILTTTPINLDTPPKKVCNFTRTVDIEAEILSLRSLLKISPKEAYNKSSRLIKQYSGNADLLYLHGQVSKRLGYFEEAVNTLLNASAYDCSPWRATEVHNSIIRKVSREHQVLLFDFAKLVENEFTANTTFFDELHPQNLYYDKGMEQLGMVIRSILKL